MMSMAEAGEKTEVIKKSTFVFVMFYLLGTLNYVPSNFYITANDYWMYKFRDPNANSSDSNSTKTDLQTKFTSYYSIVANLGMVSCLLLTLYLMRKISDNRRISACLTLVLALLILTMILTWVDSDSWQGEFFIISLAIGVLINGIGACFLLSTFFLALKFPPVYLGAVLSGQAICGILSIVIQILTLSMGTTSVINAFLYFTLGAVFVAIVEFLFLGVLVRKPYYQQQVNKEVKHDPVAINCQTIGNIMKKVWPYILTMVLTVGSMIAMQPGVTSLVESKAKNYGKWGDTFFVPVCTFLAFSVFDFIGRESSFRFKSITNTYLIMAVGVVRLVFVPLLLFCNVQPRNHLEVIFDQDWVYAIFISGFAFTNGYLSNLCIVSIPRACVGGEMKIASVLLLVVMVVATTACSFLGPVLIAAV